MDLQVAMTMTIPLRSATTVLCVSFGRSAIMPNFLLSGKVRAETGITAMYVIALAQLLVPIEDKPQASH